MEDNKVISFSERSQNGNAEEVDNWMYEQRLYNPVTGETVTIMTCPASEMESMVEYLMDSDDISDEIVADIAEKVDQYVSPEFKNGH